MRKRLRLLSHSDQPGGHWAAHQPAPNSPDVLVIGFFVLSWRCLCEVYPNMLHVRGGCLLAAGNLVALQMDVHHFTHSRLNFISALSGVGTVSQALYTKCLRGQLSSLPT
jgi:hypothetical protein